MLGESMPYCPRCGNDVSEDAEYCTKCRTLLKEDVVYRSVRKRDEKDEKGEDDRYGHIIGGLIVIWLGVLLMLINQNLIRAADFGGFFLMGIGVILVFRGLLAFQETGSIDQGFGFFIGGGDSASHWGRYSIQSTRLVGYPTNWNRFDYSDTRYNPAT
ncbi:zinc-ribbon domain-containing protein [Candidatus Bathyarchaeota archaeon]|nr:zinc-ribbon domain-containing protein [Candidatus Bathyarchaeota archaeon]